MNQVRLFSFKNTQLSYRIAGQGPEMLLLFHGFGQDGRVFEPFASKLGTRFTLCLVDLYFHGQSTWPDNEPISKETWKTVISHFVEEFGIQRFSVGGFSIGAKFALATVEACAAQINEVILIAPDGIRNNSWYNLAIGTPITRHIFKSLINHPWPFNTIASTLKFLRLLPPPLVRFAQRQMETEEKRSQVYHAWIVFRKLRFNMQTIAAIVTENNINVTLLAGKKDNVIRPEDMKRLVKFLPKTHLVLVDAGHSLVLKESLVWLVNN